MLLLDPQITPVFEIYQFCFNNGEKPDGWIKLKEQLNSITVLFIVNYSLKSGSPEGLLFKMASIWSMISGVS